MDHRSHEHNCVVYSNHTKIECTLSTFSTLGLAFSALNKVQLGGATCILHLAPYYPAVWYF